MRKIQIAISSYLCIRLTWNLTGSCGQQQRLRGWSHMVVKRFQDGGRPLFWKSLYRHISAKSSDFHEILYTAADFELDERHVALVSNKKSCIGQTPSSTERISCSILYILFIFIFLLHKACCWALTEILYTVRYQNCQSQEHVCGDNFSLLTFIWYQLVYNFNLGSVFTVSGVLPGRISLSKKLHVYFFSSAVSLIASDEEAEW